MCYSLGDTADGDWRRRGDGRGGGGLLNRRRFGWSWEYFRKQGKFHILQDCSNWRWMTASDLRLKWLQWTDRNKMTLTPRFLFSGCPASVSGQNSGQFTSPNYPNNYPNDADCIWRIGVPRGVLVKVEFSDFNTERGHDELRIHDGPSVLSLSLATLSGHLSTPREVISTGPLLWFNFRTDNNSSRRGFRATFTAVSGKS